jgi:hypothetical protein
MLLHRRLHANLSQTHVQVYLPKLPASKFCAWQHSLKGFEQELNLHPTSIPAQIPALCARKQHVQH